MLENGSMSKMVCNNRKNMTVDMFRYIYNQTNKQAKVTKKQTRLNVHKYS